MSAGIETLPDDYQARAKALRAKFFNAAPVVVSREKPRIVDVSKLTFDAVRKVGAVVYHGRVYGPHPLPRDFLHVTAQGYEFTRSPTRLRIEEIKREVAGKHGVPVSLLTKKRGYKVAACRQEAIARVYVEFPHIPLQSLARMFGLQDHTTVLHAVKKHGVWRGAAPENADASVQP
jgi:hypothetical protein